VSIGLRDGRVLHQDAHGARGYPAHPASDGELAAKFLACSTGGLAPTSAQRALGLLQEIEILKDVRTLTATLRRTS
jgi:hypothetical protein